MDTARKLASLARAGRLAGGELATVVSVNEAALTCTVRTAGQLELEEVPLRVLSPVDDVGIYAVPTAGTDVLVAYDGGDRGRPRIVRVQEFDRLVFKKRGGVRVELSRDDKIILGGKAATHPAALGDGIYSWAWFIHNWLFNNVPQNPTDPLIPPSNFAFKSKVIKIE